MLTTGSQPTIASAQDPNGHAGDTAAGSATSHLVARSGYDLSPDGKRLLMVEEIAGDGQRGTSVTVAQNWFAAFRE